jgi:peroxiredoxin Q/BCP
MTLHWRKPEGKIRLPTRFGALMQARRHDTVGPSLGGLARTASQTLALGALLIAAPTLGAQATPATTAAPAAGAAAGAPAGRAPDVGDMAPDFTLPAASAGQVLAKPLKLSDYRGKTVVLAFFPKARTSGCTHQMEAYRDRYATLFHGGKDVTLIAISADDAATQASWAADEKFPFVFASDAGGAVGTKYGTYSGEYKMDMRTLYIVGADGKITYVARPFKEMVETAYTDLGAALDKTKGQ